MTKYHAPHNVPALHASVYLLGKTFVHKGLLPTRPMLYSTLLPLSSLLLLDGLTRSLQRAATQATSTSHATPQMMSHHAPRHGLAWVSRALHMTLTRRAKARRATQMWRASTARTLCRVGVGSRCRGCL